MERLAVSSTTQTHPGYRRTVNEDASLADSQQGLWVVADGMGGYAAGDVASRTLIQCLSALQLRGSLDECTAALEAAIQSANRRLLYETTLPADCQQLGSTVAVLYYHSGEKRCVCLWVGDSRLYVLRDNSLYQMTRDHSVVQEMVDSGALDAASRDSHPQSHVITRAVGVSDQLEVDRLSFQPQTGDIYLLCSDGLYNEIAVAEELQRCRHYFSSRGDIKTQQITGSLMGAVLDTPARDNITVTVISVD